jgi:hypothetical protein
MFGASGPLRRSKTQRLLLLPKAGFLLFDRPGRRESGRPALSVFDLNQSAVRAGFL